MAEKEKFVSHIYAEADVMAINLKKRWNIFQVSLLGVVAVLFAIFLGYTFLNIIALLVSYFAAYTVLALLFSVWNVSHRSHRSYVEFRALAEGLRVEFFLRLAGKHEDVSDHYLRKHKQHLQWIREVMRSANVFDPQEKPEISAIKKYWINSQLEYYSRSSSNNKRMVSRLRTIAAILYTLGLASVAAAIVITVFHIHVPIPVTTVLIISLPFLAGLIEIYIGRSTMSETAEEYSRMSGIFENANNLWGKDYEKNINIITELAKESLRENADWLLLHAQVSEKMPLL